MKRCLPIILFYLLFFFGYGQSYFEKFGVLSHIKGTDIGRTFNFNCSFSLAEFMEVENVLKDRIADGGSLFLCYVSSGGEEKKIVALKDLDTDVSLTSSNIILSDGNEHKIVSYAGSILCYSFFKENYRGKNKDILINRDFIGIEDKVLEFIYISDVISQLDREKIGSYLSIKYGISLYGSYYVSSVGDTLLDLKKNKYFSYGVTGIGRDDGYGLYQRKSTNSCSKGLTIEVDSTKIVDNTSFLLWGNNGKSTFLKKESSNENLYRIEKIWKTNILGEDSNFNSVNIEVVPEELFNNYDNYLEKPDNFLWLVNSSTPDFSFGIEYSKQTKKEGEKIIFEDIDFSESLYFTFMIAPDFFVNSDNNTIFNDEYRNIEISDRIAIYPNSSETGELFYIDFNLSEPKEVEVLIYDISGREIFKTNLYKIQNYKYSNSLETTGTYLVTIRSNDKTLVKKMVIK